MTEIPLEKKSKQKNSDDESVEAKEKGKTEDKSRPRRNIPDVDGDSSEEFQEKRPEGNRMPDSESESSKKPQRKTPARDQKRKREEESSEEESSKRRRQGSIPDENESMTVVKKLRQRIAKGKKDNEKKALAIEESTFEEVVESEEDQKEEEEKPSNKRKRGEESVEDVTETKKKKSNKGQTTTPTGTRGRQGKKKQEEEEEEEESEKEKYFKRNVPQTGRQLRSSTKTQQQTKKSDGNDDSDSDSRAISLKIPTSGMKEKPIIDLEEDDEEDAVGTQDLLSVSTSSLVCFDDPICSAKKDSSSSSNSGSGSATLPRSPTISPKPSPTKSPIPARQKNRKQSSRSRSPQKRSSIIPKTKATIQTQLTWSLPSSPKKRGREERPSSPPNENRSPSYSPTRPDFDEPHFPRDEEQIEGVEQNFTEPASPSLGLDYEPLSRFDYQEAERDEYSNLIEPPSQSFPFNELYEGTLIL